VKKRLFIAIKIDNSTSLLRIFSEARTFLKHEKIRWIDPDNLHLTITFLGDTEEILTPKIISSMDIVKSFQFSMELNSIGVFKNINFPKILWFGIKSNEIMSEIKSALDRQLKSIGFILEDQEFKPHLSIGRIKNITDKSNLEILLKKYDNYKIGIQTVNEIILYESILSSIGPTYKVIHKSFLKK
jgi:2'-5' RNA ligase